MKNRDNYFDDLLKTNHSTESDEEISKQRLLAIKEIESSEDFTDAQVLKIIQWLEESNYEDIDGYDELLHYPLLEVVLPEKPMLSKQIMLMPSNNEAVNNWKIEMICSYCIEGIKFDNIPVFYYDSLDEDSFPTFFKKIKWKKITCQEIHILLLIISATDLEDELSEMNIPLKIQAKVKECFPVITDKNIKEVHSLLTRSL